MGYLSVDPTKVSVSIAGVPIKGFADGDMISCDYDDDWVVIHSGSQGEYAAIGNPSRKCTITIRLAAYGVSNAALTALSLAPMTGVPLAATDKSTNGDLFTTPAMFLAKPATWVKSGDAVMNEWTFKAGESVMAHTGAKEVDFS